jgi:hypothetical protein
MKKQFYNFTIIQKNRLVLTDEPATFAFKINNTYTLAHNGLKVGAKIAIIC